MSKVIVLRLGHRIKRDARITTHCGLVARAFGANEMVFSGEEDKGVIASLEKVAERWGGDFRVTYMHSWRKFIESFEGVKVHLTMYGLPVQRVIDEIRDLGRKKSILIVIGGEKVPGIIYKLVDYNVAITSQPHSEVAALAVFLHEYFRGKELELNFPGAKLKVVPQKCGKKVVKTEEVP